MKVTNKDAGQELDVTGPSLSGLKDGPLLVAVLAALARRNPDDTLSQCRICEGAIVLHPKDQEVIAQHPGIVLLCRGCFEELEPREIPGTRKNQDGH